MMGFNHIAGGLAFTGIACSILDVNIFSEPEYIAATCFFSVLPDIDHTRSIVGKTFYPVAKYIDRNYGHRTITHSLAAWLAITICTAFFDFLITKNNTFTLIVSMSYLSHLILDMCTLSGIPFFYPFSTDRCVLPSNSALRIRSGDFRTEVIIFFCFIVLNVSMADLVQAGIVKSFNKNFRSFEDLREELKTDSLLKIKYKIGEDVKEALVVELQKNELTVFSENALLVLKKPDFNIISVDRINKKRLLENVQFLNIGEDSLRKILINPILSGKIQSNENLVFFQDNIQKTSKVVKLELINNFSFYIKKDTASKAQKIADIQQKIDDRKGIYNQKLSELSNLRSRYSSLNYKYNSASDFEKGELISSLNNLKAKIDNFSMPVLSISHLEQQIQNLNNNQVEPKFSGKLKLWIRNF